MGSSRTDAICFNLVLTMKIYNFNLELYKVTGIQKVVVSIHNALKNQFDCKIVGNIPYERVNKDLIIEEKDYITNRFYVQFRNSIVIVHERRLLLIFWLLNNLLFWNTRVIYVHHSVLSGQKLITPFPNHIVAISDAGIKNLTEYFGVHVNHITKIHNCVIDSNHSLRISNRESSNFINLIYLARINDGKRQPELVIRLRDKIDKRIRIIFAGDGPNYHELKNLCHGSEQFIALGYRSDTLDLINKSDYVLLFSKMEGLPVSLIEATMMGRPIICNNVGGNTEIALDGKNAFVAENWDDLIKVINNLPKVTIERYKDMCKFSRGIYENQFNFEIFSRRYIELINSIITSNDNK